MRMGTGQKTRNRQQVSPEATLDDAVMLAYNARWRTTRSGKSSLSQAQSAAMYMRVHHGITLVRDVTHEVLVSSVTQWGETLSPATIARRLCAMGAMGVDVRDTFPRIGKPKKWWLRPEAQLEVTTFLRSTGNAYRALMAFYIEWTTETGLRLEETLRLDWSDITVGTTDGDWELMVPGTKTAASAAPIALSREAVGILKALRPKRSGRVFALEYRTMCRLWAECRELLGASDIPTCTLKALRRSAARRLHVDKRMPLDIVRSYLRHENIETTIGYLRVTGGYDTQTQRQYL